MQSSSYTVKLENFSGPLDLLLQLIQRDKLDICDVDIATVTGDFLSYIHEVDYDHHQTNNFLEVAVRLILLKSRALLPSVSDLDTPLLEEDLTLQLKQLQNFQQLAASLIYSMQSPMHARAKTKVNSVDTSYTNLTSKTLTITNFSFYDNETKKPQKFSLKQRSSVEIRDKLTQKLRKADRFELASLYTFVRDPRELMIVFLLILELVKSNQAHIYTQNNKTTIEVMS